MKNECVDVLVIGAGPAGTVAASILNKNGIDTKVVEKQRFPRFVIGESLLPRCMDRLEEAGLIDHLKEQGFQTKYGAKFMKGEASCDFNFSEQFTQGWKWTWQVPRADFDKAMADDIEARGIPIEYECGVENITFNGSDSLTTVRNSSGETKTIEARFIIDASGFGRVIPRMFGLDQPSDFPPRTAMFTHIHEPDRPAGEAQERIIAIAHTADVWIWVIPFSNGTTSVGFVGNPEFFEGSRRDPEEKFAAMLDENEVVRERFKGAALAFTPHIIHAYASGVKQLYGKGFALTGNSTEFLDPIFSSGVSFATETAALAGELASRQLKGETVDWETEFSDYIKEGVDVFRSYVKAWYDGTLQKIFFAPSINPRIKNMICSVLAGYVWDKDNPYVKNHERSLNTLAKVIELEEQRQA